ncbi:MAG: cytochrome c3 family protein [Thermodesulfobacteriota bacterium]
MTRTKPLVLAFAAVCGLLLLAGAGCDKRTAVQPSAPEPKMVASAKAPMEVPVYERDIEPLPTEQCARCHIAVFRNIKEAGGKHRIDCVRCHTTFHTYNPRTDNYAEIMPKCASCHKSATGGAFHGDDPALTNCLKCHADPHRPKDIPMAGVDALCGNCHTKEAGEVAANPSDHATAVTCGDCHSDTHGRIPECADCHQSHSPGVSMQSKDCMSCHPVHKPTRISYSKSTRQEICSGCHADVEKVLKGNLTKHTDVSCISCHPSHKELEPCSTCHGHPHNSAMMRDTNRCNECHGKAHNLAAN